MTDKDYYAILHVDPSAGADTIAAAYHRLMRKYHPDKNPSPDATRRAQEINAAYEVLSDPAKRAAYDRERLHQIARVAMLRCPQDHVVLISKILFGSRVQQCPRCDGIWVERDSLLQMYALFDLAAPVALTQPGTPISGTSSHTMCLSDGTPLVMTLDEGILLTVCPTCRGVWLAASSFSKIFIRRKTRKAGNQKSGWPLLNRRQRIKTLVSDFVEDIMEFAGEFFGLPR